jgi:hypothetical protein
MRQKSIMSFPRAACRAAIAALLVAITPAAPALAFDAVALDGRTFVNKGLVAVGRIPAHLRDKLGETFGSGSGLAIDPQAWTRTADGYRGVLYMLPDRGYNVTGTTDYRARLNVLRIVLKPAEDSAASPGQIGLPVEARQHGLEAKLADTIVLTDATGRPLIGLDPGQDEVRRAAGGLPDLPQAQTGAISIDSEAVVRMSDGTFFIADEYGPYIYRFSTAGRMLSAIRPPEAFIPKRNGRDSFASNNPPPGVAAPIPPDPEFGRANNQGFEGLSLTSDGRFLVAILQSATRQDSGSAPQSRQDTRMLYYDVADPNHPRLAREHVVALPVFTSAEGKPRVAAQSELLALDENRFLLLCRDGGNGYGTKGATSSLYRRIELLDTSQASNIAGSAYDGTVAVAPDGKLAQGIVPATLTGFIDINDNAQLGRFGLHNGPPNDRNNLSEKWEGMTLAPVLDPAYPSDFFLFVSNDNDFITQDGYHAGAAYKDASGVEVDTMILVYRLTLPD